MPSGPNATDVSLCPGRSEGFRCQTTRPLGISSRSRRWAVGTGERGGEAVATATARRFPSGENAMRVYLGGPAAEGAECQEATSRALR